MISRVLRVCSARLLKMSPTGAATTVRLVISNWECSASKLSPRPLSTSIYNTLRSTDILIRARVMSLGQGLPTAEPRIAPVSALNARLPTRISTEAASYSSSDASIMGCTQEDKHLAHVCIARMGIRTGSGNVED